MQKISAFNPFIIFWLGVLTGALLIGLLFLYKVTGGDLQTSVLRTTTQPINKTSTSSTYSAPLYTQPLSGSVNAGDPSPWLVK